MKTVFIALLLAAFCLTHQSAISSEIVPFTSTTASLFHTDSKIIRFDGSIQNKRVLLNWTIGENQRAGMFELQRSTDGKNFATAALVFGTDKEDTDSYQFYEKAKSRKISYRLKIIYKDQSIEFSDVISIS